MTLFLDASAIVAQILQEDDAALLAAKTAVSPNPVTSPIAVYETVTAIVRARQKDVQTAEAIVNAFLLSSNCRVIAIDETMGQQALLAFARFGKGRHKASLNMGDCFAYACAKMLGVPLLCKGDDFIHTDITVA